MPRGDAQLIYAEASFFADLVQSGRMTLDEARADISIDARTLELWRQWLEWETWPRAMFTQAIRLRRKILEKFEASLEARVRQMCKELDEAAEAVDVPENLAIGDALAHALSSPGVSGHAGNQQVTEETNNGDGREETDG